MQLNCSELFRQQAFINGHWCDALGGQSTQIHNPADNSLIGFVPVMGKEETRRAIDAANSALPAWRARTAAERAAILRRWFNLMLEHQDDLAQLITAEQGKPLSESLGEVKYAASFMEWFAEEGKRAYGETIPGHQADKRIMVLKQPIGVCAAITPWNFPAAMITRKLAPALAAGCTMVLKPAPQTPYTALALAQLGVMAGIPEGVFNVVTGDAVQIGDELCANPVVRKLSFTGSTGVGAHLMANCAPHIKKLSLELGGNAPFIVFDDADIDAAVAGAMIAKFRNNGQTCVCANRIYVQHGVYDEFAAKLTAAVSALKVGRGTDIDVTTGPLINQQALDKVQDHIEDALSQGATLACGGQPHALGGLFFEPTVITEVKPGMKLTREETFGPVAGLIRFTDTDEVIAAANDTEFGLAAYFYSQNLSRVWQVSEALEYGMVGINTGLISTEVAPFGGIKSSGLGREGSRHGLDEYMELKYLCLDIGAPGKI